MTRPYEVIDADGHVLEPANMWLDYMEPRFRDRAPCIIPNEEGIEIHALGGQEVTDNGPGRRRVKLGAAGAIGAREGKISVWGKYADGKPGGFDPRKRIPDMDAEGIDAAFLYPTLGLFLGAIPDVELSAAVCRAYWRSIAQPIRTGCSGSRCYRCSRSSWRHARCVLQPGSWDSARPWFGPIPTTGACYTIRTMILCGALPSNWISRSESIAERKAVSQR